MVLDTAFVAWHNRHEPHIDQPILNGGCAMRATTGDWIYRTEDGRILCHSLSLRPDGRIENYGHANEYFWERKGKELHFLTINRELSCVFPWPSGHESILHGRFLLGGNGVHVLERHAQQHNLLANTTWRYKNWKGKVHGIVTLKADGTISGYDHPNERTWKLDNGRLIFFAQDGQESTIFDRTFQKKGPLLHYLGRFILDGAEGVHILEPIENPGHGAITQLHSSISLSDNSDGLFVSFNSIRRTFDGFDTRWEFFHLPLQFGLDYVRFSEAEPSTWFLQHINKIFDVLRPIVGKYQTVYMCGISAGGFAAMLFAERLAREFPQQEFRTFTINPQTSVAKDDRDYVNKHHPHTHRPSAILDNAYIGGTYDALRIADLLTEHVPNVHHKLFFDSGNISDTYYAARVRSARVSAQGIDLSARHADGCRQMYDMGVVQRALMDEITATQCVSCVNAS
ncbi:hypothetical protein LGM75_27725 [Burkholderia multivorans]|uniref:hypothetical protein n=1 Tax=Burkholderia multivorans TaxID=87883 RepID=UPI001C240598|nr:hypothetical protein [Burkholderia multivorans]MBU9469120.1 hypothetical protein [Burkholderia multivorans]MCA8130146.1 hypothetical protein [Burkholderia multivorans]